MIRVFFGQHKCASQWVTLLIERMCNELGWKSVCAYEEVVRAHGGLRALIEQEKPDFLIIPESTVEKANEIGESYRGFHIVRDPRDIVVSGYFSHMKSHPLSKEGLTPEHREQLRTLPMEAGIDLEIATLSRIPLRNLYQWEYDKPWIHETEFDRVTKAPLQEFTRILEFMEMTGEKNNLLFSMQCYYNRVVRKIGLNVLRIRSETYSIHRMGRILKVLSFTNLKKGRMKRLGQKTDHYRKGKTGDWRAHLTKQQEEEISRIFPGILEKLGYEATIPDDAPTSPDAF